MAPCTSARWVALAAVACACQNPSKLDDLQAPAHTRIALDGELDEPAWNLISIRGPFTDGSDRARPYSEIRLLRDETHVFLALYAADGDIRSSDAFDVTAGPVHAHLTAGGTATPAFVRAAVDRDGTLDNPQDNDEEWVVEAAIPIDELGPPPVQFAAERCDTMASGARRCGSWRGAFDPALIPIVK